MFSNSVERELAISDACDAFEKKLRYGESVSVEEAIATLPVDLQTLARPQLEELWTDYEFKAGGDLNSTSRNPESQVSSGLQPGEKFDRFIIQRLVGSGAFGDVYLAHDPQFNHSVALKIAKHGVIDQQRVRKTFEREARAVGRLHHANIVPMHQAFAVDGIPVTVSAFIEGRTLDKWAAERPRTHREIVAIVRKIADALHYAHEKGVIHRDLKPSNIIVDDSDEPLVADFGLARCVDSQASLTQHGMVIGSPHYMSPEQARGDSHLADAKTDVWGVGVLLFELLGNEKPFHGDEPLSIQRSVLEDDPKLHEIENIPADLATLISLSLQKKTSRRIQNCSYLSSELTRWLNDEPILSRPISRFERCHRWIVRNKKLSISLAAVFLTLATSTVLVTSLYTKLLVQTAEKEAAYRESRRVLAQSVLSSASGDIPMLLDSLELAVSDVLPFFRSAYESPESTESMKLRAACALSYLGESQHQDVLLKSLMSADATDCPLIVTALHRERDKAIVGIHNLLQQKVSAVQRVRLATALLKLGDASVATDLLVCRGEPERRIEFIVHFAKWKDQHWRNPTAIIDGQSTDFVSGLCLAMAKVDPEHIPREARDQWVATFRDLYSSHPSGAVHSASGWAMANWNAEPPEPTQGFDTSDRDWYHSTVGLTFNRVSHGRFVRPIDPVDSRRKGGSRAGKQQTVDVSEPFWISTTEVTREQFEEFLTDGGSESNDLSTWPPTENGNAMMKSRTHPALEVCWNDAVQLCNWLSRKDEFEPAYEKKEDRFVVSRNATGYRLPMESEWEYACRAGTDTSYQVGETRGYLKQFTVVLSTGPEPVGQRYPNDWGLFNMMGNVAEWCGDEWAHYLDVPHVKMISVDQGPTRHV